MNTTTAGGQVTDLESLQARDRETLLMQLPVAERLDAILSCKDSEAVVASMPPEDFWITVMEIGPSDALPLLALAQVEQLNLVFDVEWWRKADLRPAKALEWLERLETASTRKLLEWLHHADFELLVSLFKKWMRVALIDEDRDPVEARELLPPNTLDDQYYWEALYPQYEPLLERILRLLFEVNQGFYRELLNHVIWGLEAEIEEDAYRFHRGRLEDCAIPDYYDALTIYAAPRARDGRSPRARVILADEEKPAPAFALTLASQEDFFHRVLEEVRDPSLLDSLRLELASLANKVLVADQLEPDRPDALHLAVRKAASWISLGLERISSGDVGRAARCLADVYLEDLFRHGHEAVIRVQRMLRRLVREGWIAQWPGGMNLLDAPWLQAAEYLLGRTPRLPTALGRPLQDPTEGLISTRSELARAERLVETIRGGRDLFNTLGVDAGRAHGWRLWQGGRVSALEDVTLGSLVWTAAVRAMEAGEWTVEPLELDLWRERFPGLEPNQLGVRIRAWVRGSLQDAARRESAMAYLEPLFRAYEEEVGSFVGKDPPDPALLGFFLFADE